MNPHHALRPGISNRTAVGLTRPPRDATLDATEVPAKVMLIFVMTIAFVTSHLALRWAIAVMAGAAMGVEALAISIAYVVLLLTLSGASVRLPTPWRRIVISATYGGVLGVVFTVYAIVKTGIGSSALSNPEWSVALLMALYLLWVVFTHAMMAIAFGADARDEYWAYIKATYSTFRKS